LYYLLQNKPTSELYHKVREVTGEQVIALFSGEQLIEENSNQLKSEIFDGAQLKLSTTITLFVMVDKQYTLHISPVSCMSQKHLRCKKRQVQESASC